MVTQESVKFTFYLTYVLLLTTGTITFIEAISTSDVNIRHIMNIETCISIVAAYFYSTFISKLDKPLEYNELNKVRYIDWFITTPLMLLVLCLALNYSDKENLHIASYVLVVLLNYGMLISGYLGETKRLEKHTALVLGFIFFFALFGYIYYLFVHQNPSAYNLTIYGMFFVFWSIYGIVYYAKDDFKNLIYNILDLLAKCLVGIFLWLYFAKVVVI